jgi:beta-glucosidase
MVLLKNDGTLPLKQGAIKIAVVGPLADQTKYLLGNYNGTPTHTVSVLEGLKAEFPQAQITFVPGTQFLRTDGDIVPESALTTPEGKPGLTVTFSTGGGFMDKGTVLATKQVSTVDLKTEDVPQEAAGKFPLTVTWEGFLTATETGEYSIGVRAKGNSAMVMIDGKPLAMEYLDSEHAQAKAGHIHLEQGKKTAVRVRYELNEKGPVEAQLFWAKYDPKPSPEAIAAAKERGCCHCGPRHYQRPRRGRDAGQRGGIQGRRPHQHRSSQTGRGVAGSRDGDRKARGPCAGQRKRAGRELGQCEHVNAILDSWYAGEEGGAAIAETLSGKNNPAGRLPVTFYTGLDQLPQFEDYSMQNRTYRYFKGKPLYPFGYGLSYTTFSYSDLTLPKAAIKRATRLRQR